MSPKRALVAATDSRVRRLGVRDQATSVVARVAIPGTIHESGAADPRLIAPGEGEAPIDGVRAGMEGQAVEPDTLWPAEIAAVIVFVPGLTVLTRMPSGASDFARFFDTLATAAFDAV